MTTFGEGVNIFLTPQAIYEQLTNGGGPKTLEQLQIATTFEQTAEGDRAEQIRTLAGLIKSGWQGSASVNAFGAALPLHERSMENTAKLDRSQDLLSRQIDSFTTAANSVRPAKTPPENPIDDIVPFETDYERVVTSYQSDAQNNIAIYRSYDNASNYNETNMPQEFDTSARDIGKISVAGPKDTIEVGEPEPGPGSGGPSGPGPGGPSGPGYPGSGGYPEGGAPGGSHPGGAPVTGPPPGGPGGQTSPNEFRPPDTNPSYPPGYNPQNPPVGTPAPTGATPGGFVGGVPGGYSGRGGSGGGGGYGGGRGGYGGGSGGGAGGSGARPVGPGAGVGAGALAAEEAAARRAAQAAAGGKSGTGPMGAPMGGGKGKGDEDNEHERKYLIEADSEDTFGSDVLTAPQVIGDDEYED